MLLLLGVYNLYLTHVASQYYLKCNSILHLRNTRKELSLYTIDNEGILRVSNCVIHSRLFEVSNFPSEFQYTQGQLRISGWSQEIL